jgi:hypothetical protein
MNVLKFMATAGKLLLQVAFGAREVGSVGAQLGRTSAGWQSLQQYRSMGLDL